MCGIQKFYNFLNKNPDWQNFYNSMSLGQRNAIENVVKYNNPEFNTDLYYQSIMHLSRYPNGLSDLSVQGAKDGMVAYNALQKFEERAKEADKLTKDVEKINDYIAGTRHEDLKENFAKIPECERDSVIRGAIKEYKGNINSTQLRDYIKREADRFTQRDFNARNHDVHIKTSHAERLDNWDR